MRYKIIILLLCLVMLGATGCSNKSKETFDVSNESEDIKIYMNTKAYLITTT